MGMMLLAVLLLIFGLSKLVPTIPYSDPVVGVLALVTGLLLLIGK